MRGAAGRADVDPAPEVREVGDRLAAREPVVEPRLAGQVADTGGGSTTGST